MPEPFVVVRVVLLRAIDQPILPWLAAIDAGWRPNQGFGPWVGGISGETPARALGDLGARHQDELESYVRRAGYPADQVPH